MKTATVRDVQHNLNKVLAWVHDGEEVQITRRNKPVAKIVPAGVPATASPPQWPDFSARARRIWGRKATGKMLSKIVTEQREERM